ncbi:MAG: glycosyltransferase family 2 protein [Rhodanobacteraceae bacterium]
MLSFLRARAPKAPPPRPPLRDLNWDGRALDATLDDASSGIDVALELDGAFFSTVASDRLGQVRFEFPFAPQADAVDAVLRRGRNGESLTAEPLRFRIDEAGFRRDQNSTPRVLAPLSSPSFAVPFAMDVGAIEVAIVVPVYDAPDAVETCLDAVLRHTTGNARLIVIDDASPDPAIAPLLARYAQLPRVVVLANPNNRGFTATANLGIAQAGRADVVLLNADTRVGPNWLDGLRRAAYCADDVATATAVSDNAGAFSVPELEHENALPACWTFDESARALWQHAGHAYPELPTGNGFCMYIRRSVIDAIGALDEAAFPQGYGEENDFCQRASARGLRHLIAGNVLVHHARSRSFGHERRALLGVAGMAVLRERWPRYEAEVGASLHSFARRVLDWRVRRVFAGAERMRPTPRVLYVGAAIPASAMHETWHFRANVESAEIVHSGTPAASTRDTHGPFAEELVSRWLQDFAIEAIVANDEAPPSLTDAARKLGVPIARFRAGEDAESAVARAFVASQTFTGPAP